MLIAGDDAVVQRFVDRAYHRLSSSHGHATEQQLDRGEILVHGTSPRLVFNDKEIGWPAGAWEEPSALMRAFYGSRELFRLVAARVESCWAVYGGAVQLGTAGVAIVGRSGIGKTTLLLELMARGARLYSDECVFVDKSDGSVDGLLRALMIRESALELLSSIPGVYRACRQAPFHPTAQGRMWYAIDPSAIFDADPVARPSPLGAFVVLDDERSTSASMSPIAPTLAAAEFARRCHAKRDGIKEVAEISRRLGAIECYRLRLGSPSATADLIYDTCNGA